MDLNKLKLSSSTTRFDLKTTIIPVLNKFEKEGKPFQIIAGDMATGLALSKEGYLCLNISMK